MLQPHAAVASIVRRTLQVQADIDVEKARHRELAREILACRTVDACRAGATEALRQRCSEACATEQKRRQEFDSLMAENKKLKQAARCSAHGAAGLPRFHKVRCPARHRSTMTCFCAALCPEIFASSSGKQAGRSFLNFSAALSAQFPAKGQQKRRKHT